MNDESSSPTNKQQWWVPISPVIIYVLGWMTHSQISLIKGHWPPATTEETRAVIWFCILFALSSWFIFKVINLISPRDLSGNHDKN